MNTCPYVCNNKTSYGYCMSTACINPKYNQFSVTKWLEKADYVQVVRCKDCKWYDMSKCMVTTEMGHHYVCRVHSYRPVPEDYCSQGERKDG